MQIIVVEIDAETKLEALGICDRRQTDIFYTRTNWGAAKAEDGNEKTLICIRMTNRQTPVVNK